MSDSQRASDSELELSARLLRSLAHRIRGDLSVVTNDLVYLTSLVDPAELERPRARCATIAASLTSLGLLTSLNQPAPSSLKVLADSFGLELVAGIKVQGAVRIDRGLVQHAAQLLRQLLGPWRGSVEQSSAGSGCVQCQLRFENPRSLQQSYAGAGRLASAELGERFVVEACLFDLIIRDHGWRISFLSDGDRVTATIDVTMSAE